MQRTRNRATGRKAPGIALLGLWVAVCPVLAAGDEDTAAPAVVKLDQLLKLPDSLAIEPQVRGGSTRAEWRSRFDGARKDVVDARAALARTRVKLEELAGESSAWKMSAPGLGALDTGSSNQGPLDYSISTEMRNNREELERSERHLTELGIEANLAGVPESWRGSPLDEARADDQPPE